MNTKTHATYVMVATILVAAIVYWANVASVSSAVASSPTSLISTQASSSQTGTLVASMNYSVPHGTNSLEVTLEVENGIVTAVETTHSLSNGHSRRNITWFDADYKSDVVGKALSEVNVSRIAGATLTTNAFNRAIAKIRQGTV